MSRYEKKINKMIIPKPINRISCFSWFQATPLPPQKNGNLNETQTDIQIYLNFGFFNRKFLKPLKIRKPRPKKKSIDWKLPPSRICGDSTDVIDWRRRWQNPKIYSPPHTSEIRKLTFLPGKRRRFRRQWSRQCGLNRSRRHDFPAIAHRPKSSNSTKKLFPHGFYKNQ